MQNLVEEAGCNNITFNESRIPIIQQMDKLYQYLGQKAHEAQLELNTLESLFSPESSTGTIRRKRSIDEDSLVLSQHLLLVQDSI